MAVQSLFFNSAPDDPRTYQAADFASYFGDVLSTGILSVDEDAGNVVEHVSGLTVNVTAGQAIMKGYKAVNDGTELTLNLPETDLDRIDRIVYRLDLRQQSRFIELAVKEGESSETPTAPTLQRDNVIYEISLAQIFLTRNTSSIEQSDITDERLNEELCGLTSSLITVPTQQFLDEWQEWFDNLQLETPVTTEEFNDHSTRHENGGADEINLAGLQGESAELSSHKADTAMPHKYLDEGEEVEYQGIKYRLVIINGEPFLEVVEV